MKNIVNQVIAEVKEHNFGSGFDKKLFIEFVEIFYRENQKNDFLGYISKNLVNYAISAFSYFQKKQIEEFKVRIFNPGLKKDNFESHYTVVEIISPNIPFLVDSTVAYFDKQSIHIRNVIHPIYSNIRDNKGNLKSIGVEKGSNQESVIQMHIDKIADEDEIKNLEVNLIKIIQTVSLVVGDWKKMLRAIELAGEQIDNARSIVENQLYLNEVKDFISWIVAGNLVVLGVREFDIVPSQDNPSEYMLREVEGSAFGVFRSQYEEMRPNVMNSSFAEVSDSVNNPYVIEILKSRYRSRVHRVTNAERIRIQKVSPEGKIIGEYRIVGLFVSAAYSTNIRSIPLVRNKVNKVIAKSGYIPGSHNYKELISVLESYPRDELLQISENNLLKNAIGIVSICGRSQVRFFPRKDRFERFVSCLVYTPRERSSSDLRAKIKEYLAKIYGGEVTDSFVQITDSNLIRLQIIIRTDNQVPKINELEVQSELEKMTRIWSDDLFQTIKARFGNKKVFQIYAKYKNAFSVSYQDRFNPRRAAIDIEHIEKCLNGQKVLFKLYKDSKALEDDIAELKIYNPSNELKLSNVMPVLESFGLDVIKEHTYLVAIDDEKTGERKKIWVHYFNLRLSESSHLFSEKIRLNFEKTVSLAWEKHVEIDALNKLTILSHLSWKQIYLIRAYSKYVCQFSLRHSIGQIAKTLVKYNDIAKDLVILFENKFNPFLATSTEERKKNGNRIINKIEQKTKNIRDVSDDDVIRKILSVILATLRTNYYQFSSADQSSSKNYISFKFDCSLIPGLPLPHPFAEIFVYSKRFEAIHLRGGKVARGGLRWSDRQNDYRTEILGLMKAQMTKNSVIVPVGSKGGFVVKAERTSLSREEFQAEGIECYKRFLSGMLDITDNITNGKVMHPSHCIIYDDKDPYLVVAADKGTATFSDIANSVSNDYKFWLGDAFASGGSAGYDHKKMGITAKGAWISVMRHFWQMDFDTQSQDFTCIGIGDMAGDVFGNGMLLSKHIRLIGAFNHMHIFLDPNPDSAVSFKERSRMFKLAGSTWMDYDKSLISKGGGIFSRSDKSINITPEIQKVLDIKEKQLAPDQLIQAILKAPVDLLWNGGIGTYVKSSVESNDQVGDRSNDSLRVNGQDLRCKVVGEGGNLGFTQRGRIEFAMNGGRINTDALDNSAGVDCSDHEVNIKIALADAVTIGKINIEQRNKILESMTEEVSELVLKDNHMQSQAISFSKSLGYIALGDQSKFLDKLEKSGLLNIELEFLPLRKEIDKRQNDRIGMTSPELCVMLSYAKMDIYNKILGSSLIDDDFFNRDLISYFPQEMQKKFSLEISRHQLRREIIATQITNYVVNRAGITFVSQICQETGFGVHDVVKSFIIACNSFELENIWSGIESSKKINSSDMIEMMLNSTKLLERSVKWLLKNQNKQDILSNVERFKKIADELFSLFPGVMARDSKESFENNIKIYSKKGADYKLATRVAAMDPIASTFDISEIVANSNFDLKTIAKIYFEVGTRFHFKWLRSALNSIDPNNYWQKLSNKAIIEDLYAYQMKIAKSVVDLTCKSKKVCETNSLEHWIEQNQFLVDRFNQFIADLKSQSILDISLFIVVLNRLKPLFS